MAKAKTRAQTSAQKTSKTSKARKPAKSAKPAKSVKSAKSAKPTKPAKSAKTHEASKLAGLLPQFMQDGYDAVVLAVEGAFGSGPGDIVSAIKMDHDALRRFIDVLKDPHREMTERRRAYAQFSALLKSHTVSEERVVYAAAEKLPDAELRIKIAEGFVEHQVASDVMGRMDRIRDAKTWGAHANVLAELVEHHLKEEEEDLLPRLRRDAPKRLDDSMLSRFLSLRASTQRKVTARNGGVLTH